jgi:hypothetical protein
MIVMWVFLVGMHEVEVGIHLSMKRYRTITALSRKIGPIAFQKVAHVDDFSTSIFRIKPSAIVNRC